MTESGPLVSVRNLKKYYPVKKGFISRQVGVAKAVDNISFDIYPGETLGLVGESGCGKSTAAEAIVRLEEPTDGEVIFNSRSWDARQYRNGDRSVIHRLRRLFHSTDAGESAETGATNDVTRFDRRQLKAFRRQVQMVMQDPSSSFDPRMTVGQTVAEMLMIHGMRDRDQRRTIVEDLLERVGLSASDYDRFPHEFSGGQKQRIGLARALVLNPEFIVADEPVSALDVSIQAEILSLIEELQEEFGLAVLFISHDLSVVREICDRVAVMYLGEIVEIGTTEALFADPRHPYTEALLSSIPTPDPNDTIEGVELSGEVPSPEHPPPGCRFHTRCHKIIPPDSISIDQDRWRRVVDLKIQLANRQVDPIALRELVVSVEADVEDPGDVDRARFAERFRAEYDLVGATGNGRLDTCLEEVIDALYDDDIVAAIEAMESVVTTICSRETPPKVDYDGHMARCHLLNADG